MLAVNKTLLVMTNYFFLLMDHAISVMALTVYVKINIAQISAKVLVAHLLLMVKVCIFAYFLFGLTSML